MENSLNEQFKPVQLNINTLSNEEMEFYSTKFSENNNNLKTLLLNLWNNGFNTKGCCGGHLATSNNLDLDDLTPYISIVFNNNQKDAINSIINKVKDYNTKNNPFNIDCTLSKNKDLYTASFYLSYNNLVKPNMSLTAYNIKANLDYNNFYKKLNLFFKNYDKNKKSPIDFVSILDYNISNKITNPTVLITNDVSISCDEWNVSKKLTTKDILEMSKILPAAQKRR